MAVVDRELFRRQWEAEQAKGPNAEALALEAMRSPGTGVSPAESRGYKTYVQEEKDEYSRRMRTSPGGLSGILHHRDDDPGDEAAYPGNSRWPSFSHPPTPPPWGWTHGEPVWSWEIGWMLPAGTFYDTPPPGWTMPGTPGDSPTVEYPPMPPSGSTLPLVPGMEGDAMIIVLPRWQQPLGRYLTPNSEQYDSGVKPIKPVDSWHYGKMNYRLSAQRAMGRIT